MPRTPIPTTWREEIVNCMRSSHETWDDVVNVVICEGGLDKEFNSDYGLIEGPFFTLWTEKRVYFPVDYDGSESVRSVSRNPDGRETYHVGGGG